MRFEKEHVHATSCFPFCFRFNFFFVFFWARSRVVTFNLCVRACLQFSSSRTDMNPVSMPISKQLKIETCPPWRGNKFRRGLQAPKAASNVLPEVLPTVSPGSTNYQRPNVPRLTGRPTDRPTHHPPGGQATGIRTEAWVLPSPLESPGFLGRLCVNILRHACVSCSHYRIKKATPVECKIN